MTVNLYRCSACGAPQPSPGRLEGNWCPGCKKVGTLQLALDGEAMALAQAIGGPPPAQRARMEAEAFAALVGEAEREAGGRGQLAADLPLLRNPDHVRVLLFLEEEGGIAAIIDVFRAGKFRTKTHALRALLMLRQAGLVMALEEDRWMITQRARDAIEAVRMAAG